MYLVPSHWGMAQRGFPKASPSTIDRYGLAYYNLGRDVGIRWVKRGARGYYLTE